MYTADAMAKEVLRAAGPAARLRLALDLSDLARDLALAGLRRRFPDLPEPALRVRLVETASRAVLPPRAAE